MKTKVILSLAILVFCVVWVNAQYPAAQPVNLSAVSVAGIAAELANISRGVQVMNERLKAVIDKSSTSGGRVITDQRQKIDLGIQALTSAEQRVIHRGASRQQASTADRRQAKTCSSFYSNFRAASLILPTSSATLNHSPIVYGEYICRKWNAK